MEERKKRKQESVLHHQKTPLSLAAMKWTKLRGNGSEVPTGTKKGFALEIFDE